MLTTERKCVLDQMVEILQGEDVVARRQQQLLHVFVSDFEPSAGDAGNNLDPEPCPFCAGMTDAPIDCGLQGHRIGAPKWWPVEL